MKENQKMKNLIPTDLLEEEEIDDDENKIFDEPSSGNESGMDFKQLEQVNLYLFIFIIEFKFFEFFIKKCWMFT